MFVQLSSKIYYPFACYAKNYHSSYATYSHVRPNTKRVEKRVGNRKYTIIPLLVDTPSQIVNAVQRYAMLVSADVLLIGKVPHDFIDAFA